MLNADDEEQRDTNPLLDASDLHDAKDVIGDERRYLLVVDAGGSHRVRLAKDGQASIGRAFNADVRLSDDSASRRHAVLDLSASSVVLTDLCSQNGTRVNGERIEVSRQLRPGDIIRIGSSTLVFQSKTTSVTFQDPLSVGELMRRARQELERSLRFQRPITITALRMSGTVPRREIDHALARGIRSIDVFGWSAANEVLVLMPELDADDAFDVIARILRVISPLVSKALHAGFATGPTDAEDLEGLLDAARAGTLTATAAGDGVGRTFRSINLGGQSIVVADASMLGIYKLVERLAESDLPVLVNGETGTGKELVAGAIHAWSARKGGEFVVVNCAAFAETLVESELFGHEVGAFTGATAMRQGVFERAQGGTVFLDEVAELSPHTQAALLRVLETRRVQRVGGQGDIPVDFRLVSATNRDLTSEVVAGHFRQDLFYRLGAAVVRLPPLRERTRELPVLAQALLDAACRTGSRLPKVLSAGSIELCMQYAWPGNVRELKHVMQFLATTVDESVIETTQLEPLLERTNPSLAPVSSGDEFRPLYEEISELERTRISAALDSANGNQKRAAAVLSMPLRTLQAKVKQYQLSRSKR